MLRIKQGIDLKELEKFGFRKHKNDDDNVFCSKWTRNWVEADTVDGYSIGSSGWEFYPTILIYDDRHIEFIAEVGWGCYRLRHVDFIYDLIKADMVEKVVEE